MEENEAVPSTRQRIGLLVGPAAFAAVLWLWCPEGMSPPAAATLAATLWIAIWWVTEAVPVWVASLLPIVLFPALGVAEAAEITRCYGHPIIFLFLGGFLIALAMERWNLHRRIALRIVAWLGASPARLLLGFMVATGFLSMWISNTATTMMMLPIGMAVISQVTRLAPRPIAGGEAALTEAPGQADAAAASAIPRGDPEACRPAQAPPRSNFGAGLMLGVAYAASIGGVATLIGTPPNAVFAGVVTQNLGIQVGFLQWMLFGLPLAVLFMVVAWLLILKLLPPEVKGFAGGQATIRRQMAALGPLRRPEVLVLTVFLLVSGLWVLRPFVIAPLLPGVNDTVIAVFGSLLLFLLPGDEQRPTLLDKDAICQIPWGILVLFGGGFALAEAFQSSGLDTWTAGRLAGLEGTSLLLALVAVTALVSFLTNVAPNTATASLFMPILATSGAALGVSPLLLMAAASAAASCAFMMPVATPPNAIVFGSGYLSIPQMARVGFWVNLVGVGIISLLVYYWMPVVWGL